MPGNHGFLYNIALLTVIHNYASLNGKRLDVSNVCRNVRSISISTVINGASVRRRYDGPRTIKYPALNAVNPRVTTLVSQSREIPAVRSRLIANYRRYSTVAIAITPGRACWQRRDPPPGSQDIVDPIVGARRSRSPRTSRHGAETNASFVAWLIEGDK